MYNPDKLVYMYEDLQVKTQKLKDDTQMAFKAEMLITPYNVVFIPLVSSIELHPRTNHISMVWWTANTTLCGTHTNSNMIWTQQLLLHEVSKKPAEVGWDFLDLLLKVSESFLFLAKNTSITGWWELLTRFIMYSVSKPISDCTLSATLICFNIFK